MTLRGGLGARGGALLACALTLAAAAPSARLTAVRMPAAFSAAGTVTLDAVTPSKSTRISVNLRVAHRAQLTRVDVLGVTIVANAGTGNVVQQLPFGGIAVVFDQHAGTVTLWSSHRRLYYRTKLKTPWTSGTNAFGSLGALTKYALLSFSMTLTGHQPVNGHAASVYAFSWTGRKQGGTSAQSGSGHVALADDLGGIPIHGDLTIAGHAGQNVTLAMDLSSIDTAAPPPSRFALPRGYKRTTNLSAIVSNGLTMRRPMRMPMHLPGATPAPAATQPASATPAAAATPAPSASAVPAPTPTRTPGG